MLPDSKDKSLNKFQNVCGSLSQNFCGFRSKFADSAYNLRNQLSICGFRDSLRLRNTYIIIFSWFPQTSSGFHTFFCGFRNVTCFWNNFEHYSVLAICPWNLKQQRRSKKNSNVADSRCQKTSR